MWSDLGSGISLLALLGLLWVAAGYGANLGRLQGRVVDQRTGNPIARARARIVTDTGPVWTRTDRDGRFTFASVPVGSYDVTIHADGHAANVYRTLSCSGGISDADVLMAPSSAPALKILLPVSQTLLRGAGSISRESTSSAWGPIYCPW
jgi:hypothetical protein